VRRVYGRELLNGVPIRWTKKKLDLASRYAAQQWRSPDLQAAAVAGLEARLNEDDPPDNEPLREAYPEEVVTEADLERWRLSTALAKRSHRTSGSAKLWDAAHQIYRSRQSLRTLEKKVGHMPRPAADRPPLRFRRSELGLLLPTDPQVARDLRQRELDQT
jgi:hypothetical protein